MFRHGKLLALLWPASILIDLWVTLQEIGFQVLRLRFWVTHRSPLFIIVPALVVWTIVRHGALNTDFYTLFGVVWGIGIITELNVIDSMIEIVTFHRTRVPRWVLLGVVIPFLVRLVLEYT